MPQQPSSAVPAVVPLSLGLAKDDFFYLFYYILFVKKRVLRLTELRVAQENQPVVYRLFQY